MILHNNSSNLIPSHQAGDNALATTYLPTEIINIAALTLLWIMGTVGNFLVIYVFGWKKRKTRKRFETLLAILGIVDMFASMVVPLLFLYGTITKHKQWHFGFIGCKVISSLFPASVTISEGILILISYERYKSIKDPFEGPLKRSFIILWLLGTILVALLLVSPYIHVLELVTSEVYGINTCTPSGLQHDIILLYSLGNFLRDFSATAVMLALGVMTTRLLKQSSNNAGVSRHHKQRQKNTEKARKMLIVVVCVFSCCVIPLDLYQVIVYTLYKLDLEFSPTSYKVVLLINTILTVLQIANSATNVLIYSRMHKDFTRQIFSNARSTWSNISRMLSELRNESESKRERAELLEANRKAYTKKCEMGKDSLV